MNKKSEGYYTIRLRIAADVEEQVVTELNHTFSDTHFYGRPYKDPSIADSTVLRYSISATRYALLHRIVEMHKEGLIESFTVI